MFLNWHTQRIWCLVRSLWPLVRLLWYLVRTLWHLVTSLKPGQIIVRNNSRFQLCKWRLVCCWCTEGSTVFKMTFFQCTFTLLHFFQIWGEKGHFLQWTHKKSLCCCSPQRSSSSPIRNSLLYCMQIMWVFQDTEWAWPGFHQDTKHKLEK